MLQRNLNKDIDEQEEERFFQETAIEKDFFLREYEA